VTDPRQRLESAFDRHYRDVALYCRRRCPTPEDAEEAATEVFAVAWRRIGDLPEAPEDRLWLFGVARRVVANQARGRRRAERLEQRLRSERPPAHVAAPEVGAVGRALGALSDGDRELLMLACWDDLRPAEIAKVLNQPAPVVSTRLWRARRRFAHVYEAATRAEEARPLSTSEGAARCSTS
jgi:RNA polymerase sigma-70 factor (ECF subfamily)